MTVPVHKSRVHRFLCALLLCGYFAVIRATAI